MNVLWRSWDTICSFSLDFYQTPHKTSRSLCISITTVQGLWGLSFCLVMVISVQLLNFVTRKKYRIADEHFVYFISQLWFLIGMFAKSLQYFSACYNLEVERGGRGWGEGLQSAGGVHAYDSTGTAALVGELVGQSRQCQ